jgi:hypothetical protein
MENVAENVRDQNGCHKKGTTIQAQISKEQVLKLETILVATKHIALK